MGSSIHPNGANEEEAENGTTIQTELTDEVLEDLRGLEGKAIVGVSLYEDSIAYEDEEEIVDDADRIYVDMELYVTDQTLLCLYGASIYTVSDEIPQKGLDAIAEALGELAEEEDLLRSVRPDPQSDGVLMEFGPDSKRRVLIAAGGWALDRWEELPGDEEGEFDEDDWDDLDDEDEDLDDWDDEDLDDY